MDPAGPLLLLLLLTWAPPGGATQTPPVGSPLEICLLPPKEGPCRALVPSYYYDRYSQSCRRFKYGGCEGNANNFYSREACEEACGMIQKVPKICRLKVNERLCKEPQEQYFFNLSSMTCEKFISGGCNTNENEFSDEASCMKFCLPKKAPSFCYTPKDEGLCSANVIRYYFNSRHQSCEAFTYTGCGGNENNFYYIADCQRVCEKASKNKKMPKNRLAIKRLKNQRKWF